MSRANVRGAALSTKHVPGLFRSASTVLLHSVAANGVLYAFMIIVARAMNPTDFGLFSSLFALVALANVALAAFQTAVATEISPAAPYTGAGLRSTWQAAAILALGSLVAIALLSPLLSRFLRSPNPFAVVAAGIVTALYLPWNVLLGAYQGSMRFKEYGHLMVVQALMRLLALGALFVRPTPFVLLMMIALTMLPPLALGASRYPLPRPELGTAWVALREYVAKSLVRAWRPVLIALALGFPSLGDVILVRHLYAGHAAGIYAGIVMFGRILLLLPVAINTVLYPYFVARTSREGLRRMLRAQLIIAAMVAPVVVVAFACPALLLHASLGAAYVPGEPLLGPYALGAALYSVASVAAFFILASQDVTYLLACVSPILLLQILSPFIMPSLLSMTWATTGIAACFAFASIAWASLRSVRQPSRVS